jgi:hypothetical protein
MTGLLMRGKWPGSIDHSSGIIVSAAKSREKREKAVDRLLFFENVMGQRKKYHLNFNNLAKRFTREQPFIIIGPVCIKGRCFYCKAPG